MAGHRVPKARMHHLQSSLLWLNERADRPHDHCVGSKNEDQTVIDPVQSAAQLDSVSRVCRARCVVDGGRSPCSRQLMQVCVKLITR